MTLDEYLAQQIPRMAVNKNRRFPHVEPEDFEQEMQLRAWSKRAKFLRWFEAGNDRLIRLELNAAATRLGFNDDRQRRAAEAAAAGYDTWDEQFYSIKVLRGLLPILIEAGFEPANAIERATQGTDAAGIRRHSKGSENLAETYMAVLIDVCSAFRKLTPYQQRLLTQYYDLSQEDTQDGRWERESFASSQGMTLKAYQLRVDRAMRALQKKLGGENPWVRDDPREPAGNAA